MDYLPDIEFSTLREAEVRTGPRRMRRVIGNSSRTDDAFFARNNARWEARRGRDLRRNPEIDPNGLGPIQILRDAFQKYIVNSVLESNTIGLEITYVERSFDTRPKTIFLAKKTYDGQTRNYRINNTNRNINNLARGVFNEQNAFQNDQLEGVIQQLEGVYKIIQITLCEVYNDANEEESRFNYPFVLPIRILYRKVPNNLTHVMDDNTGGGRRRNREEMAVVNPDVTENPRQLQVVPAPEEMSRITDSTCGVCLDNIVGEGCRVNCPGEHLFHCDCINQWRNTRNVNNLIMVAWDTFHNDCPLCRAEINTMYHVNIPENFVNSFGKRNRGKGNKGNTLKTINNYIKYLEKIK